MLASVPSSRTHDPARFALERLLEQTEILGAFPPKTRYLAAHPGDAEILSRLLAHRGGRYLFETPALDDSGSRLALTVAGTLALDSELGRREQKGLVALFEFLAWNSTGVGFARRTMSVGWMHALNPFSSAPTLARRLTQLASPPLSGQVLDPSGYRGESSACGVVDPATGYFTSVSLAPSFPVGRSFEVVPERPLLPTTRIVAECESSGLVHIGDGTMRIATLLDRRGPRTLATLLEHPNRSIHCLDMQAAVVGLAPLPEDDADNTRLAVLGRRVQLLESVPDRARLPAWAKQPRRKAAELRAEIEVSRSLGDLPLIGNAARVLRRALNTTLEDEKLRSLRERVVIGEYLLLREPE
jgi:hypothetical protein